MKKYIDISAVLSPKMPVWPSSEPFKFEILRNHDENNVQVSRMELNMHTGTHVDSSKHFVKQGKEINEMDLRKFVGEVLVVECLNTEKIDQNVVMGLKIPVGTKKIIFKTTNSLHKCDIFNDQYVALTTDAARWLTNKGIELLGIDAPSIELYHGRDYVTHQVLLNENMVILEGLDLSLVKPGNYYLMALPLRIEGAEASPVRAILVEEF